MVFRAHLQVAVKDSWRALFLFGTHISTSSSSASYPLKTNCYARLFDYVFCVFSRHFVHL